MSDVQTPAQKPGRSLFEGAVDVFVGGICDFVGAESAYLGLCAVNRAWYKQICGSAMEMFWQQSFRKDFNVTNSNTMQKDKVLIHPPQDRRKLRVLDEPQSLVSWRSVWARHYHRRRRVCGDSAGAIVYGADEQCAMMAHWSVILRALRTQNQIELLNLLEPGATSEDFCRLKDRLGTDGLCADVVAFYSVSAGQSSFDKCLLGGCKVYDFHLDEPLVSLQFTCGVDQNSHFCSVVEDVGMIFSLNARDQQNRCTVLAPTGRMERWSWGHFCELHLDVSDTNETDLARYVQFFASQLHTKTLMYDLIPHVRPHAPSSQWSSPELNRFPLKGPQTRTAVTRGIWVQIATIFQNERSNFVYQISIRLLRPDEEGGFVNSVAAAK